MKFEYRYPVRLDDLDFMSVVGDGQWLTFLQRARIELMNSIGFSFENMVKSRIAGVVVSNHITYKRRASYGDQLTIEVTPELKGESQVRLSYRALNQHSKECVVSEMLLAFVDAATGKPTKVPDPIRFGLAEETSTSEGQPSEVSL